jgi:ABC-type lipoprotein release transport system permease subunit
VHVVRPGRRGYAVVEGRDLTGGAPEVVVERGLAREWEIEVGDELRVGGSRPIPVVGIAVSPDNVAFPLASAPRVYTGYQWLVPILGQAVKPVNVALLWARDPSRLDVTLAQARAVGFGITNLRFVTREGVRVILDQAAGIVIALLVSFSLVALGSATVMLAASARAEVERRLETIGVMRALGFSRAGIAGQHALEAALVALPAAAAGLALGSLVSVGPTTRLLETLNELGPGRSIAAPLAGCLVAIVGVVVLATAWPAWRVASRPPAEVLRGVGLRPTLTPRPPAWGWAGRPFALGVRFAAARRARAAATVTVLAASIAVVILMLALAGLFERLQTDPGVMGKRYDLVASLPDARLLPALREVQGVEAASSRWVVEATDSFRLGERVRLIAYPGDHRRWERTPLARGRMPAGPAEVAIGAGLETALGVRPGGTLAVQIPSGGEVRFRVVGVVRALENEGRVAYARPDRLLAADPSLPSGLVVRLAPGADPGQVSRRLTYVGAQPQLMAGATPRSARFLGVLATLLRVVAAVNGLVCLYALMQALALTALERRSALAVLRAAGAGPGHVALVLAGTATLVVAVAAPAGILLERFVLGPAVARLAADYATLPLAPSTAQLALVVAGTAMVAAGAAGWVAHRVGREPIVAGLREE